MVYSLFIAFFCFAVTQSCSKEKLTSDKTAAEIIKSAFKGPARGGSTFDMINDITQTRYGKFDGTYHFSGRFTNGVTATKCYVNNYGMDITDQRESFSSSVTDSVTLGSQQDSYFGKTNKYRFNNSDDFAEQYVPTPVKVKFTDNSSLIFSKSQGIDLEWNPDPLNNAPVVVVVQYLPSDEEVSSDAIITKVAKFLDNNGPVSLSSDFLSDFPVDKRLNMYVGRGSEGNHKLKNESLTILGLNVTAIPGIVLTN